MDIDCNGFTFIHNFDSGNLGKVEFIGENDGNTGEAKIYEFNIWTRPDCAGTEYVNANRTWFHFGIANIPEACIIKLNVVMNKQGKMYGQGMAPVYRTLPTHPIWERIKERPTFMSLGGNFFLTFLHRITDIKNVTYFAFTYPFSYTDLENYLSILDMKEFDHSVPTILREPLQIESAVFNPDDIYYHREVLCKSIEGRNVYLITVTAMNDICPVREERLSNLFPDESNPRSYFFNKKVVFLSARVHPGETPSSFILNGMLNYLMVQKEQTAINLRKNFVFKIIPMLNPDGVFHGNYRTDIRGTNLNRVYNNPSPTEHPSIYGARALAIYYYHGRNQSEKLKIYPIGDTTKIARIEDGVSDLTLERSEKKIQVLEHGKINEKHPPFSEGVAHPAKVKLVEPRLFLYIDMHGHASKKGIFMYGNHFKEVVNNIECRLFPKLVSINSPHFHFDSCNFTEKNMYAKDKRDGSSKEGSGRVAVFKATGLIHCYTLECNYNTGKTVNTLPPLPLTDKKPMPASNASPPKYTPVIYEETGRHILVAILDLAGLNPHSRLPQSTYRTLNSLKEALKGKVVGENQLQLHKDKTRISTNQKVCRGESRAWKRPKGPGAVTVGCNNVPTSSATVMSTQKKLRSTAKRSKMSTEPQSRLEKKSSGDTRRLIPEQRRKKLKPKYPSV